MVDSAAAPTARRIWEPVAALGAGRLGAVLLAAESLTISPLFATAAVVANTVGAVIILFAPGLALLR